MTCPRIRFDLNILTLVNLPEFSCAPRLAGLALYQAIQHAGYEGVQGGDPKLCREAGLRSTSSARVDAPADALAVARRAVDEGQDCVTIHAGTGYEDDGVATALAQAIVEASQVTGMPLYLETHRATITQDFWRTVRLVERVPGLLFNGDFSHWYTGHEMTYGNFAAKLDFIGPIFERVRFMHGRIGNSGSMQVDVGDGRTGTNLVHFREIWTRACEGFLHATSPESRLVFTPELLRSEINYARVFRGPDGVLVEETDRWLQALQLCEIATECMDAAQARIAG